MADPVSSFNLGRLDCEGFDAVDLAADLVSGGFHRAVAAALHDPMSGEELLRAARTALGPGGPGGKLFLQGRGNFDVEWQAAALGVVDAALAMIAAGPARRKPLMEFFAALGWRPCTDRAPRPSAYLDYWKAALAEVNLRSPKLTASCRFPLRVNGHLVTFVVREAPSGPPGLWPDPTGDWFTASDEVMEVLDQEWTRLPSRLRRKPLWWSLTGVAKGHLTGPSLHGAVSSSLQALRLRPRLMSRPRNNVFVTGTDNIASFGPVDLTGKAQGLGPMDVLVVVGPVGGEWGHTGWEGLRAPSGTRVRSVADLGAAFRLTRSRRPPVLIAGVTLSVLVLAAVLIQIRGPVAQPQVLDHVFIQRGLGKGSVGNEQPVTSNVLSPPAAGLTGGNKAATPEEAALRAVSDCRTPEEVSGAVQAVARSREPAALLVKAQFAANSNRREEQLRNATKAFNQWNGSRPAELWWLLVDGTATSGKPDSRAAARGMALDAVAVHGNDAPLLAYLASLTDDSEERQTILKRAAAATGRPVPSQVIGQEWQDGLLTEDEALAALDAAEPPGLRRSAGWYQASKILLAAKRGSEALKAVRKARELIAPSCPQQYAAAQMQEAVVLSSEHTPEANRPLAYSMATEALAKQAEACGSDTCWWGGINDAFDVLYAAGTKEARSLLIEIASRYLQTETSSDRVGDLHRWVADSKYVDDEVSSLADYEKALSSDGGLAVAERRLAYLKFFVAEPPQRDAGVAHAKHAFETAVAKRFSTVASYEQYWLLLRLVSGDRAAVPEMQVFADRNPDWRAAAYAGIGSAMQEAGDPAAALDWYERAAKAGKNKEALAYLALNPRTEEAAGALCDQLVREYPGVAEAEQCQGARLVATDQDRDAALAHFDKAIGLAPRWATPYAHKAELLIFSESPDFVAAAAAADTALRIEPDRVGSLEDAALARARGGFETAEAVRLARRAVGLDKDRYWAIRALGESLQAARDWGESIEVWRRVAELPGIDQEYVSHARSKRARALLEGGRPRDAVAEMRKVIAAEPKVPQHFYDLGEYLEASWGIDVAGHPPDDPQRFLEARAAYQAGVALDPDPHIYFVFKAGDKARFLRMAEKNVAEGVPGGHLDHGAALMNVIDGRFTGSGIGRKDAILGMVADLRWWHDHPTDYVAVDLHQTILEYADAVMNAREEPDEEPFEDARLEEAAGELCRLGLAEGITKEHLKLCTGVARALDDRPQAVLPLYEALEKVSKECERATVLTGLARARQRVTPPQPSSAILAEARQQCPSRASSAALRTPTGTTIP